MQWHTGMVRMMSDPREPIVPSIQRGVTKRWQPIEHGCTEWHRGYREWLRIAPAPGSATLSPATVRAGSRKRLRLVFTVGEGGIAPYGHVAVEPQLWSLELYNPAASPGNRGRIKVECSNPAPALQVEYSAGIVDVLIQGHPLEEGDTLTFIFGEETGNPAHMPPQARMHPFPVAVAVDNSPNYRLIADIPQLEVVGAPAERFILVPKPAVTRGQPFALQIIAVDGVERNLDAAYEGTLRLICTDASADMPTSVEFTPDTNGVKIVDGCRLNSGGVHYVTAVDERRGIAGRSSPLTSDGFFGGPGVYFGDIHCHTWHCDGRSMPDEAYEWSRWARGMDFGALTNHVEGAKRYHVEDFWRIVQQCARRYNVPGEYVAFLAYEWGSWDLFGDKDVYFLDDDMPYWGADMGEANRPDRLWGTLPRGRAITISHQHKYGGKTDWEYFDPQMQPLAEVFSRWGVSEDGGPHSVQAGLERGYRFGFIASADNHQGQMGNHDEGHACVLAGELTRESLFDSMAHRRTYATTGEKMLLNVTVNGHGMGQEFDQPGSESRSVNVRFAGTGDIDAVHILRCNREIHCVQPEGSVTELVFIDDEPLYAPAWYYVRVAQRDGAMAWSSPIWVDPQ